VVGCAPVHAKRLGYAAAPALRDRLGSRIGENKIIQISTHVGQAALPQRIAVSAEQVGHRGFMDAVGQEVATFNIGVTIVEPGGALRRSRSLVQVTWSFARFRRSRGLICHSGRRHSLEAQPLLKAERTPRIAASA